MRVADYLMNFLYREGVRDVFTVSGGGIMHLIDSLGRHPHLRYICNYHEQACAIAAESYSRINGALGACLVTTGPGSAPMPCQALPAHGSIPSRSSSYRDRSAEI